MKRNIYLLRNQYSWFADKINLSGGFFDREVTTEEADNIVILNSPPNFFKPYSIKLRECINSNINFGFKIFKEIEAKYLFLYVLHEKPIAWKLKDCNNNSIQIGMLTGMYKIIYPRKTNIMIRIKSIGTKQTKKILLSDIDKVWIAGS